MREEGGAADLAAPPRSNTSINSRADGLALLLRVGDAGELAQKHLAGVDMHERDVVWLAEQPDDLLRLALPHQAVVDEDAGQLLADRLMDQDGGDRLNRRRPTIRRSPARSRPVCLMRQWLRPGTTPSTSRPAAADFGDEIRSKAAPSGV